MAQMNNPRGPTDNGKEYNRFFLQNCGAGTPLVYAQLPLFASNDDLIIRGAATAFTVLTHPAKGTTVYLQ